MREYTAGANEEGVRLSRFVERVTVNLPQGQMYKAFRNKRIKINGKKATPEMRLQKGDHIELYLNDVYFTSSVPTPLPATSKTLPLFEIIYEDAAFSILYKPAGVLCHSDNTKDPTLLDAYLSHLQETGEFKPEQEAAFTPALANRLDRGTEGLVLAAKTYPALRDLNEIIRLNLVEKLYLCIAAGTPATGVHQAYLRRDMRQKRVHISTQYEENAKPVETGITVLETCGNLSLCEVNLITGRTHQIRAHMAFLDTPLLGDKKYGHTTFKIIPQLKNQALCAAKLNFSCNIPQNNTLHYLAGKSFSVKTPAILQLWNNIKTTS